MYAARLGSFPFVQICSWIINNLLDTEACSTAVYFYSSFVFWLALRARQRSRTTCKNIQQYYKIYILSVLSTIQHYIITLLHDTIIPLYTTQHYITTLYYTILYYHTILHNTILRYNTTRHTTRHYITILYHTANQS